MEELVDKALIPKILKLNLPIKLICDNKRIYPMLIRNKRGVDRYVIALELYDKDIRQFDLTEIELKGRIDVEYLKYRGEVKILPIMNEPGYYEMYIKDLYKFNQRVYKRVPYKRLIHIKSPINHEATLINFSASGALIYSDRSIDGDSFSFSIVLNKKELLLDARIVEQKYDDIKETFVIRCCFENVDEKTRKLLALTVKEIIIQAKRRLQQG